MKKNIAFIVILICSVFFGSIVKTFAQQSKIDSLQSLVLSDRPACSKSCLGDSGKVNHLLALAYELSFSKPDTALKLCNEALQLSERAGWQKGIGQSYHYIGWVHYCKSNYSISLEFYFKALGIWNKLLSDLKGDKKGMNSLSSLMKRKSSTYGTIGLVYTDQGDYIKAFDYSLKALKIDEELVDKDFTSRHLLNIGLIYWNEADYAKALDYYFKALKIQEEIGDRNGIARNYGCIGLAYSDQGDYDKALNFYFKALKMDEERGNNYGVARHLGNIGIVYDRKKDYPQTLIYYFKALKIDEGLGNKNGIARHLGNIGIVYFLTKKYSIAENYLKKALTITESIGYLHASREFNETLSEIYTQTGDFKKALLYYKKSTTIKDSLLNTDKAKEITRIEMNNSFEKKEAATKAEQDKKDALANAEIKRQTLIRNTTFGGVGMIGIFSFFLIRSVNRRRKTSFEKQVSEVEMTALRSQMNPHFIFNSLHSINNYMMNNDKKNASDYLGKFSKLMRLILENSREQDVPLEKDLLTLELYLELEAMRFENKFTYKIEVADDIDPENTLVPPMILQPFVENSILHGMQHKESEGKILIRIQKENNMINCIVEDNGVGRQKAMEMKEKTSTHKGESLGMKITNARIDIINKIKKAKASVNIVDLAEGMRVEVKLPLELAF